MSLNSTTKCHLYHDETLEPRDIAVLKDIVYHLEESVSNPGALNVHVVGNPGNSARAGHYSVDIRYTHNGINWGAIFQRIRLVDPIRDHILYLRSLTEGHKIVLVVQKRGAGGGSSASTQSSSARLEKRLNTTLPGEDSWIRAFDSTEIESTYKSGDFVRNIKTLIRHICVGLMPAHARQTGDQWVLRVAREGHSIIVEFGNVNGRINLRSLVNIVAKFDIVYSASQGGAAAASAAHESLIFINLETRTLRIEVYSPKKKKNHRDGRTTYRGSGSGRYGDGLAGEEHMKHRPTDMTYRLVPTNRRRE